jgi:hypothetical protein
MWVRASEAGQRLAPGSAGVSPAKLLKSMPLSFFIHAGETPALPVHGFKYLPTLWQFFQPGSIFSGSESHLAAQQLRTDTTIAMILECSD